MDIILHDECSDTNAIIYAKFQSSDSILEGIFIVFSRYTKKTLGYCRTEMFELHKFAKRKVFFEPWELIEVTRGKDKQIGRMRGTTTFSCFRKSCPVDTYVAM